MIVPEPPYAAHPLIFFGAIVLATLGITAFGFDVSVQAEPEPFQAQQWNFDGVSPGSLPGSFVVGTLFDGRPAGEWKVLITACQEPRASACANYAERHGQAHKLLLVGGTESANIDLTVSYLAVAGKADLGGGLVSHATDDRNYYLLRASLVEQKIRLYRVVKGVQQVVKQIDYALPATGWHQLQSSSKVATSEPSTTAPRFFGCVTAPSPTAGSGCGPRQTP